MKPITFVAAALLLPILACAPSSGQSDDTQQAEGSVAEGPGSSDSPASDQVVNDPFAACTPPSGGVYEGDTDRCAVTDFECPGGQLFFEDECGCGCAPRTEPTEGLGNIEEPMPEPILEPTEFNEFADCTPPPGGIYAYNASECAEVAFACNEGEQGFEDECGCGCAPVSDPEPPVVLSDEVDPDAGCTPPAGGSYSGTREFCARARIGCVDGMRLFYDDCGCGCAPI